MNGILIIDKPVGLSSHDCVNRIRKAFRTKKVGHSGTLDVEASGVLVLGINKGTKLLTYLNQDDKTYRFTLRLGTTTETLDHASDITEKKPVGSLTSFQEVLTSFIGTYSQVPPAYSAVKVSGKKLYTYARNNEPIPKVAPRDLTVYSLTQCSAFITHEETVDVDLEVKSTKGLYVRQLAADIATKLQTVGHTTMIRRLQAGWFSLEDAVKLEEVTETTPIISMADALKDMPAHMASVSDVRLIGYGQPLTIPSEAPMLKLLNQDGQLLAIYEKNQTIYKPKNVFI